MTRTPNLAQLIEVILDEKRLMEINMCISWYLHSLSIAGIYFKTFLDALFHSALNPRGKLQNQERNQENSQLTNKAKKHSGLWDRRVVRAEGTIPKKAR